MSTRGFGSDGPLLTLQIGNITTPYLSTVKSESLKPSPFKREKSSFGALSELLFLYNKTSVET